jgi:hypothetical protein
MTMAKNLVASNFPVCCCVEYMRGVEGELRGIRTDPSLEENDLAYGISAPDLSAKEKRRAALEHADEGTRDASAGFLAKRRMRA